VHILLGKYPDAIAELDGLSAAARAAHDDESLGLVLQNLGDALIGAGQYARAIAVAHEALEHDAKVFGNVSRRAAEAHTTLGNAYAKAGQRADAVTAYELAIAMFEKIEKDTTELGEPLTGLASLRDPAVARPLLERAVQLRRDGDPADLAASRFALGRVRHALHDPDAHLEVEAAIALWKKAGDRATSRRVAAEAWLAAQP
jgi:tetratricopeptide (TPR) repeat protein